MTGLSVLASVVWTVALIVDGGPWDPSGTLLIGVGLLVTATVATIGMIVGGGRWAHRTAVGSIGLTLVVASLRDVDVVWWIGVTVSVLALVAMFSRQLTSGIRKLPAATGPPPRAIAPALVLLFVPTLIGFVSGDSEPWAILVVGLSALVFAFLYTRVVFGGLVGIRVLWPLLAISVSPWMGWLAGSVSVVLGVGVAVLAWHPATKASFHPPLESGTTFPIPPELAPSEILDAAQIDDQGRPI